MSNENMREEFEEWYLKRYGEKDLNDTLVHAEKMDALEVWSASRAALCVELPERFKDVPPWACYEGGFNDALGEVVDIIQALGVRTR